MAPWLTAAKGTALKVDGYLSLDYRLSMKEKTTGFMLETRSSKLVVPLDIGNDHPLHCVS